MAEIRVVGIAPPEESPSWFKKWAGGNNSLILKIYRSLTTLTLSGNISSAVFRVNVAHGVAVKLPHGLKREISVILKGSGRCQYYKTISSNYSYVTVKPFLAQTLTNEISVGQKRNFSVMDGSIFNVGDLVQIDGSERKITNIVGNVLTLSDKVDLRVQKTVTLARETVTFVIL
jgi:hypothetical protein